MRLYKIFTTVVLALFSLYGIAAFEGNIQISLTDDKGVAKNCIIKLKDTLAIIQPINADNKKFDSYIINLQTGTLMAVSNSTKKVVLSCPLDSLTAWYENRGLKDGYKQHNAYEYKTTDKTKTVDNQTAKKLVFENELVKHSVWATECTSPLEKLLPFLRLLGFWNDIESSAKTCVVEGDSYNKASKRNTTVRAIIKSEKIDAGSFKVASDYVTKDLGQIIRKKGNTPEGNTVIQSFFSF